MTSFRYPDGETEREESVLTSWFCPLLFPLPPFFFFFLSPVYFFVVPHVAYHDFTS